MGIFVKNKNPGAYRGRLTCPVCRSEANRLLEWLTPFRARYKCRKCGINYQYDISNNPNAHPYAAWKNRKWDDPVASFKHRIDSRWEKIRR